MTAPICHRCNIAMRPGTAIAQTVTGGAPDLGGEVMTFSAGGPGVVVRCWKCPACGRSITGEPV